MCELQADNRHPWLPSVNSKTKQIQIIYTDCCILLKSKWQSNIPTFRECCHNFIQFSLRDTTDSICTKSNMLGVHKSSAEACCSLLHEQADSLLYSMAHNFVFYHT